MTLLAWLVMDGRRKAAAETNGEAWPPAGARSPFPIAATLDTWAGWNKRSARVITATRQGHPRAVVTVEKGEEIW